MKLFRKFKCYIGFHSNHVYERFGLEDIDDSTIKAFYLCKCVHCGNFHRLSKIIPYKNSMLKNRKEARIYAKNLYYVHKGVEYEI